MRDGSEEERISEEEIIRRVLGGETEEFRHLVRAYEKQVYWLVYRQVGDEETAKELTQDCFVKAFRKLHTYRVEARFSTWLIRIALNTSRSYFSSRRFREKERTVAYEEGQEDGAGDERKREDVEQLRRSIKKLSPKLREVIVLCGLEQMSYEEAAEVLETPVGTVRSRLHRARRKLKSLFFEVQ